MRTYGVALVVGLLLGLAVPGAAVPRTANQPTPTASTAPTPSTISLLTGDRVRLREDGTGQTIRPGTGRDEISFVSQRYGDHAYLIPSDALRLVADGTLDRRLFDVRALAERTVPPPIAGYGTVDGWQALKAALRSGEIERVQLDRPAEPSHRPLEQRSRTATGEPAKLSFGVQRWPHRDDEPVDRTVTYRNPGHTKLQLQLTVELRTRKGQPAPPTAVELSDRTVTVPPGGTRTVTVTSNTKHQGRNGTYDGQVTAFGGTHRIVTPIAVTKEVESYDLKLKSLGRDGLPSPTGFGSVLRLDDNTPTELYDSDGTAEVRLPKGKYVLTDYIVDPSGFYSMVQPTVRLREDRTIVADARTAGPVSTRLENTEARPALVEVGFFRRSELGYSSSVLFNDFEDVFTGRIGRPGTVRGITGNIASQWAKPRPNGSFRNSPYTYALADTTPGEFPTGYQRTVSDDELAAIRVRRNSQVPGRGGELSQYGFAPGLEWSTSMNFRYDLPSKSTHFVDPRAMWAMSFDEFDSHYVTSLLSPVRSYHAGTTYDQRWSAAVFGPALPGRDTAFRTGNTMLVDVPMYSDAANHVGYSAVDEAETVLLRSGKPVARSNEPGYLEARVPAAESSYELRTKADRHSVSGLSTTTEAAWTFRSRRPNRSARPLPLWTVRYMPDVDEHNTSQAGRVAEVPLELTPMPGARVGRLERLTVQVSTDDGSSWRPVRLEPIDGRRYVATVRTPGHAKFVSLRATASDSRDNRVEQTTLRAYAVGRRSG